MITGDPKDTALAMGNQLGLVDEEHTAAITGPDIDAMDEEELRVDKIQAEGEVCSMTGVGLTMLPPSTPPT
jgi:magnesium-transporting ATPase (P-type)